MRAFFRNNGLTIALSAAPTKPRTDAEPNKVEGNALRVNDNSVEGEEPVPSPVPARKE